MIAPDVRKRLFKNRLRTSVSLDLFVDVVEDLKRIAKQKGFTNYKSLIRALIGIEGRNEQDLSKEGQMKKEYDFSKGIKNPYAKRLKKEN